MNIDMKAYGDNNNNNRGVISNVGSGNGLAGSIVANQYSNNIAGINNQYSAKNHTSHNSSRNDIDMTDEYKKRDHSESSK